MLGMRQRKVLLSVLLILSLVAVVGGCKKAPPEVTPAPVEPPPPPPPPPPPVEVKDDFETEKFDDPPPISEQIANWNREGVLQTIYFAFDSSELTAEARSTLQGNANWLKGTGSDVNVVIEGHCDERGTIEYNLALGERRADSVREYLKGLGIAAGRVRIITYGEERPVAPVTASRPGRRTAAPPS
jgi:peptidoglycan-associated lipoprotein